MSTESLHPLLVAYVAPQRSDCFGDNLALSPVPEIREGSTGARTRLLKRRDNNVEGDRKGGRKRKGRVKGKRRTKRKEGRDKWDLGSYLLCHPARTWLRALTGSQPFTAVSKSWGRPGTCDRRGSAERAASLGLLFGYPHVLEAYRSRLMVWGFPGSGPQPLPLQPPSLRARVLP